MPIATPVPIRVSSHPNLPGRFTHIIAEADARRLGWRFFGDIPFGVWRTRRAAQRAARILQARGFVSIRSAAA